MARNLFSPVELWTVGLLLLALGRGMEGGGDVWEDDIKLLELADGEGFKRLAYPLVEMTANAYRYPDVISIGGWTLVDAVAPVHGGMHALLYKFDSNTRRMVLAFRGTELSESESSRADICADEILWGHSPIFGPVDCSQFSNDTLDYYKQAMDYTRETLRAHPQASLLLTGHSLGAALAILMTATFGTNPLLPVIGFSAVGTKQVLEKRSLKLTSDHDKKLYIIADKWDEVMRTSWKNQVGTLCLYETTMTENCTVCFEERKSPSSGGSLINPGLHSGPDIQLGFFDVIQVIPQRFEDTQEKQSEFAECSACFHETHYLKHVIDLVVLGNKPTCEPHPLSKIYEIGEGI